MVSPCSSFFFVAYLSFFFKLFVFFNVLFSIFSSVKGGEPQLQRARDNVLFPLSIKKFLKKKEV